MSASLVAIELLEVEFSSDACSGADAFGPYFVARLGPRFVGRSAPLAAGSTRLDFRGGAEAGRWVYRGRYDESGAVPVRLELWADRDTDPPDLLGAVSGSVPFAAHRLGGFQQTFSGDGMTLTVAWTVESDRTGLAVAPRSDPDGPHTAVVIRQGHVPIARVTITEMDGVWEAVTPTPSGRVAVPLGTVCTEDSGPMEPLRFSRHRTTGYRQEGGRAYLNRTPAGEWPARSAGTPVQYIDVRTEVKMARLRLPADAELLWSVTVPDDPIVEDPGVRREVLGELRKPSRDETFTSRTPANGPRWPPSGSEERQNRGRCYPAQAWEALGNFELSNVTETSVTTKIHEGESRVRIHLPNEAGDRFVLTAAVVSESESGIISVDDVTGMITMWQRIVVEYRPLVGSLSFAAALPKVGEAYAAACVQLDFDVLSARPVPSSSYAEEAGGAAPADWVLERDLGYDYDQAGDAAARFADDAAMFPNRGKPGYFTLGAALLLHPVDLLGYNRAWQGTTTLHVRGGTAAVVLPEALQVNMGTEATDTPSGGAGTSSSQFSVSRVRQILVAFGERDGVPKWLKFPVRNSRRRRARVAITLGLDDMYLAFVAKDGDLRAVTRSDFGAADYGIADGSTVTLYIVAHGPTLLGVSPAVPDVTTTEGSFVTAGRLVVGSWDPRSRDPRTGAIDSSFEPNLTRTIVHEFAHAFGVPHKCAQWGYTHGMRGSCAMNYNFHALRRDNRFLPGTQDFAGGCLCGLHVAQIRRVMLQDNQVLSQLDW